MIGLIAIAILAINVIAIPAYGLYEDQYMICNNHYVCQITNIDDYNQTTIEHNFKYNLDTFNLVD